MKKKIQYLKTLEYFIRSIKKRICKTEKFKFSKACSFMHSILGWGSFCTNSSISEEWHGSDQPVPLLRHYWVFSSSGLLDRLFLIFLLKISHRFHMGSNQAQLCHGQQTTWKPFQTLISKWNSKITFIWKEDFGPLSNSPVLFLLSTGKMLLTKLLNQPITWKQLDAFRHLLYMWWRRLAEVQTEHQNGEERGFQWL